MVRAWCLQLGLRLGPGNGIISVFCFFFSLTAVPSENQCLSSGAYEWPVLVSLKHAVLSQHWFLLQEWFRESLSKLMAAVQLVNYIHVTLDVTYWLSTEKFMPTVSF